MQYTTLGHSGIKISKLCIGGMSFGKVSHVDDAVAALDLKLTADEVAYLEEPYTAHELVGPQARPGEKPLAGTTAPKLREP